MCRLLPRYVILLCLWISCAAAVDVIRNEDICGLHNGRRLYLELGEQGVLHANNVTLVKNLPHQDGSRPYLTTNSSHDQCSLELVTCPSCVISVTFKSINLLHHCGDGGMTIDSPCRCDYVWISEPPYEDVSGTPFCGHYAPVTYRSNTRTLSIALLYSQSHKHAFSLEYTAERNRLVLKGSSGSNDMSKSMNNSGGGVLTSPFFPSRYPRDLGMEYIIACPTEATSCRVRVLFSDFQLAPVSIMEFYDWNGQRLDVSSGARFRPPIIVSTGPSLLIRFYANGGTGLGYKAFYSFVSMHLYDTHSHPITDCGGYVENLGGAITMMDMVGEGVQTYDCVWLIRPPKSYMHMKTHMYLKVITFAEMAGNTELIIKQGPTSALMPLEVLRHPVSQLQPPKMREHITPVTNGFHVSFRGSFGPNSRLAISYAAFSYMDCFTGSDFLCQNHRCISTQLNCDGFDHCGDNSDEPATCLHAEWEIGMHDRKWHMKQANYYFPKIDRYPDLKTATLVFVASSLGLIVLISALIVLLYRVGARARQQRDLQSRLRTISELLDGARIDEISITDDPPVYEAPPNYDEVIKIGMEDETATTRRKKHRSPRNHRRSRSIPSSQCSCDYEPQLTLNIYEDPTTTNRSDQPTPTTPNSIDQSLPIPESPPPPYITPPGTIQRQFTLSLVNDNPGPSRPAMELPAARISSGETSPESTASSSSSGPIRRCTGECVRRRSRQRDSRSLPASRTTSLDRSPVVATTTTAAVSEDMSAMAVEECALGAYAGSLKLLATSYHQDPPPQSTQSSAASASTRPESDDTCSAIASQHHQSHAERVEEHEDEDEEDEPERAERRPIHSGCSCEGACGCASDRGVASTSTALLLRRNSVDESPSARSRIIRLLAAGSRCASRTSTNLTNTVSLDSEPSTTSANSSSPCSTVRRGAFKRKISVCSRDSHATKVSSVSAYGSYDKLHDDFEVVSETTSILGPGTLANTPKATPRRLVTLSTTTCDVDSLYKSIRVLDTFLAQRNTVVLNEGGGAIRRKRPVTVMLFGTPNHSTERSSLSTSRTNSYDSMQTRRRFWRSTEDNLAK